MSKKTANSQPEPGQTPEQPTRADDSDAGRSGLLANISHELRTPMDAVLGYVELLGETPLDDTQQAFIGAIERAARGMLDIMDDVLNLSRMRAGKLVIHNQPFSIRDCLDSVAQMLAPSAYRKGLDFIRLVDHDVPANFIGDPVRIRQILVNLIGNAIKFTRSGHVRLSVSAQPLDAQRFELVIRVTDTGIGIAPEDLPRLFEPFSQPARPQGDIAGTGLGLVISKSLCEAMDGSITVHSTADAGSTFCARIPLESIEESFREQDGSNLLAKRAIVIACSDTEQADWIARNFQEDGASTRIVADMRQLAVEIGSSRCSDDLVVSVLGARDLADSERLVKDWQPAHGQRPVLCLVSSVSGHVLRQIADAVDGDAIPAHSSTVSVTRHVATLLQKREPRQDRRPVQLPVVAQPLAGLYVLVAEDNQFGRDYLQMLLTRHGATVDLCRDGRDACEMIARHRYDLVLMDVRMPRCDGIQAMQNLAATGKQLPPIIGLTAAPEECCRALNAGMTDCLLKPVRPGILLKYITSRQRDNTPEPPAPLSFIDAEMRDELNRELPQRASELLAAIAHGNMTVALEVAHKLNGIAALCGFTELHASAASIEGLIRQEHVDRLDRLTRQLESQIDQALASLVTP